MHGIRLQIEQVGLHFVGVAPRLNQIRVEIISRYYVVLPCFSHIGIVACILPLIHYLRGNNDS